MRGGRREGAGGLGSAAKPRGTLERARAGGGAQGAGCPVPPLPSPRRWLRGRGALLGAGVSAAPPVAQENTRVPQPLRGLGPAAWKHTGTRR